MEAVDLKELDRVRAADQAEWDASLAASNKALERMRHEVYDRQPSRRSPDHALWATHPAWLVTC